MKHKIFLLVISSVVMFTALPSAAWSAGVDYSNNGVSASSNQGNTVVTGPNGNTAATSYSTSASGYRPSSSYSSSSSSSSNSYSFGQSPSAGASSSYSYGYRPSSSSSSYNSGQSPSAGASSSYSYGSSPSASYSSSSSTSPSASSSYSAGQVPAQRSTSLVVGSTLNALPNGCSSVDYQSSQYYQCGTSWLKAYFGGSGAYYQVVAAPY